MLGVLGVGSLALLMIAGPVDASITIPAGGFPPGTTSWFNNPTTWNFGAGSVSWPAPPPPGGVLGTGSLLDDTHATSKAPGGTWGTDSTVVGWDIPWSSGGTWTVTWTWSVNFWYQVQNSCNNGGATLAQWLGVEIKDPNGNVIAGPTTVTLFSAWYPSPYTLSSTTYTSSQTPSFTGVPFTMPGNYELLGWVKTEVKSVCVDNEMHTNSAEIDMDHNPTPQGTVLSQIVLS